MGIRLISKIIRGQIITLFHFTIPSYRLCFQVNGKNIEAYGHDMAVQTLKHAGDEVTLVVKYFKPASLFLNRSKCERLIMKDLFPGKYILVIKH